jgi:hypothetical protein
MSRHPQLAALPQLTYADVAAELKREAEQRARVYPDRVAKGMMQAAEAEYQRTIWRAIIADMEGDMRNEGDATPRHSFSHAQRVTALQRELDMRRQYYPGWVAKSRMTQAQADTRIAAIGAMLYRYQCGFGWRTADGLAWYQDDVAPTKADRTEWRDYWNAVSPAIYSDAGGQATFAL